MFGKPVVGIQILICDETDGAPAIRGVLFKTSCYIIVLNKKLLTTNYRDFLLIHGLHYR